MSCHRPLGLRCDMSNAAQVLVVYGVLILATGFILGSILGMVRMNEPSVRNLATAHVETLMQGAMHLGLAFAVVITAFDSGAATLGAWLLVIGSAMQAVGVTLNWAQDVGDQFAERSTGFFVNSASTLVISPGLAIIVIGVLANI